MTLRTRLLLAQGPLALALALVGVLAVLTLSQVGRSGERILQDNYRSVLAAQRMKEALERIDGAAMFLVIGERERGLSQAAAHRPRFEEELKVQEGNITEAGEREATAKLRRLWTRYQAELDAFLALPDREAMRERYVRALDPAFVATKNAADDILALNQDAMVRKSDALRRQSERVNALTIAGVLAAFVAGLFASSSLVHRALRPVAVLSQAVRRLGQGDLGARARVDEGGEIGQLAADFNAMAEHLKEYRQSSLGELLQAQQASQASIDSLPDPVVVFRVSGELLNVNQAAERVLGLSVEAPGEPLARVPPEVRQVLERVRAHVLGGKGAYVPLGYEEAVRVDTAEGPGFFLPRASPVYGESGGIAGAAVVLQDVTRLRRFDELKNNLVATVAHEFRTPLTSLRMAIHLCIDGGVGPLTEKQADLLYAARQDCERLQGIVDDLLNLSRLQAGQLELEVRPSPVAELLERAVATQRAAAEQGGVTVSVTVEPGAETVEVDPERIDLALVNLLSNAVRHTPPGGRVEVKAASEGSHTRFEVTDTGEGIAPEHHKRIFERFYRVPGARSGAAGLGLSIVKDIVEAHGGEVGVESAPGRGSRFWFTVPPRRAPPA